ncbi:MAG: osmotically inducible protein OsmC [Gemmatimonadales bacterium]|nr:Peroxiredoxin OsmC [bacterium HR33]GIW53366.1 MAG: osmotically inducible protein OsmC [Gemmatimonadales bacterium]
MPTSSASATWDGTLKEGKGRFTAGSGAFQGTYSFGSRFEGSGGTNPEELIAAAHAACFSMALSAALERQGKPAKSISTNASCTLEMVEGSPKITKMKLEVRGDVPGISQEEFLRAAEGARDNCPVSKALKGNLTVELEARLES